MPPSTSQEILQYLKSHKRATVREISIGLSLTKADIRYHLKQLIADNAITALPDITSGSQGRPARVFMLSPQSSPNNDRALLLAALETLSQSHALQLLNWVDQLADNLPQPSPNSSPILRITSAIQILNTMGYDSAWEASAFGPRIYFQTCPYSHLVGCFPDLCQMDQQYLSRMCGTTYKRVAGIFPEGHSRCVFVNKQLAA